MSQMDYRRLLKKLMLAEYDWFGESDLGKDVDDPTLSIAKFGPDEIKVLNELRDEAFADWLIRGAGDLGDRQWSPETASFQPF